MQSDLNILSRGQRVSERTFSAHVFRTAQVFQQIVQLGKVVVERRRFVVRLGRIIEVFMR